MPSFSLKNLKGEVISLESLKGKILVLDFWATWCGPCIIRFPGMLATMEKYKNNPDVVFLFVNTLESTTPNRLQRIKTLLNKNKYNFNVLLDEQLRGGKFYKLATELNVIGIPTKFIINKEGNIIFRESGGSINKDLFAEELSMMIDLVREKEGL